MLGRGGHRKMWDMTYTAIHSPDIRGNEEGGEGLVLNHGRGRRQSLYGPSTKRYSLKGAEPSQPYPRKVGRLLAYGGFSIVMVDWETYSDGHQCLILSYMAIGVSRFHFNNFSNHIHQKDNFERKQSTSKPTTPKSWIHIRQQPKAGRACTNSSDRRPIDPPPIVQLQISDFDPDSPYDMEDMRGRSVIIHCSLHVAAIPGAAFGLQRPL